MNGYLESIEVSNFKSYSGTTIIKFKPFTAVVGPNGSGKSNLMDAISFVLGEKTSHLRGHKVTDLIYGANTGRPQSSNATVTATYINEDGVKSTFTRMVKGNSTEFKYNGSVVSSIEYKRAIQSINVFVKEKNFLVYQGEVPNIATKSPKEITQLVEEISGSVSFKQEYDDLKKELEKGETEVMLAHQAMRDVRVNRKKVKSEEKKDREREALIDQYDQDVLELGLLELFYNNKGIDGVKSNGSELKQESIDLKMKLEPLESELKGAKKSQGKILRQVSVLEKKLSSMDTEKTDKTSTYIKAKQLTASESDKLKSLTKQIDNIKKSLDIRNNTKKDLESQMSSLKSEVKNEEDELKKLSMSTVLGLSKAQESEYTSLQQTLDQQSLLTENEIEKIESEIITNQENMEALKRQQTNILLVRNQASLELKEQTTRLDNLNNDIKYSGERIIDLKEKIDTLEKSDPATKILEINAEIEELHISEETMRLSEYEKNKLEKQQEVSAKLKQKFPGVLGRLCEFVTPIHPRYELAVTRVLGPHFKSILCDKLTTAQECIRYMKEQRMERETFFAFDFLKTKPTNLSLRDIRDPPGVKLAIDIIKYDSNNNVVNSAVQFVCRDTLVCETVDDAREVAYGHSERQQTVSLDGTVLAVNGRITGGAEQLRQKAKQFSTKSLETIVQRKSVLREELKQVCREKRSALDIKELQCQLAGFENQRRFSTQDVHRTTERIKVLKKAIDDKQVELDNFEPRVREIEDVLENLARRKQRLKDSLDPLWDEVFARFCRKHKFDIKDIKKHPYLNEQKIKLQKRKLELENHISRLKNQIQYEMKMIRDDENKIDEKEEICASTMIKLNQAKLKEESSAEDLKKLKERIDLVTEEKTNLRNNIKECENRVKEIKQQSGDIKKSLEKVLLKKTSNELELSKLKEERHLLYQNCKMNAINLRLLQGSLHSGSGDGDDSSSNGFASQSHTQATAEKEDRIKVDFSCLSDELKTLENASEVSKKIKNMKVNLANKKHIVDNMIVFGSKGEVFNEKFKQAKETLDERTQAVKTIKQRFDEVKKNRHEAFTKCMQFLTTKVSDIYKELTQNQAAQADLYPDNTEEPYLDGLRYFCVAPGKRYLNMEDLSGGEKTLVALALLFAIHAFKPSPFFVVDEIDAALDNTNIGKVVHYIKLISQEVQCIVISLKQEFYSEADALVGIYGQKISNNKCSGVLSVDISNL